MNSVIALIVDLFGGRYVPDFTLLSEISVAGLPCKLVAAGRIWGRDDMREAAEFGADAVVIGKAITNPMAITRYYNSFVPKADDAGYIPMETWNLFVKMGCTWQNYMTHIKPSNSKLKKRAIAMVCEILHMEAAAAERLLTARSRDIHAALKAYTAEQEFL